MLSFLGSMLLGTKKRAMLLVVVAAALAAGLVYTYLQWTISDLRAQVEREGRRADAAERNVREYATAIQERNKRVDQAKERAEQAKERADKRVSEVLKKRRKRQQEIQDNGAHTAEELNQWLEQRFPSQ